MSKEDTYNGWTNRATWHTNLVISNEYSSYKYWSEKARELVEKGVAWPVSDLRELMKRRIGRRHVPDDVQDQVVNWHEIAESWIDEARNELERDQ